MTYKGDAHLEKLLKDAGETRPLDDVKAIIKGVLAAPEDIAAPDLWLSLFKADKDLAEQLKALKNELAATKNPAPQQGKLSALRNEMKKRKIDGFYIPRADEFHGEYVPANAERLAWATEFTGSAGTVVVLEKKAGFFTDGRYTLAARKQVNAKDFDICSISKDQDPTPTMTPAEWIEKNLPKNATFGIDPWIMSENDVVKIQQAVKKAGGILVFVDSNPLDAAWQNRPAAPLTPAVPHPLEYAGKTSEDKQEDLADALAAKGADALAIALPEETCWLLNVRGGDVPCTPFVLSYTIAHKDGGVDWYVDQRKITTETRKWVGKDVRIHDITEFENGLAALGKQGKVVWVDPATAPVKVQSTVTDNGGKVLFEKSPLQLMKALKNDVEIEGMAACHIRDGAALTRFLSAISEHGAAKKYDEISASDMLQKFRAENDNFRGLSFDTISGAGGNGAIIHYHSTPATSQKLDAGPVYLVDSGGQYLDGTTDVTRAVALSPATDEMKENFTRVLKGHIQVAMAEFPVGTTGDTLDKKARASLKEVNLDYAHGTGHGVGSYLSVHEGPCGISEGNTTVPLQAGMILSNEPGYYKEGEYGIRIESLVTVVETGRKDAAGRDLLAFKTLTMAPIDRNLIDSTLLEDDELKWLNDYHAEVQKNLLPLLDKKDPKAAAWLKKATAPIKKPPRPGKIARFCL